MGGVQFRSGKAAKQADPKTYPYTHKIEFLGVGKSENGDRYLRRRVKKDVALISVAKLLSDPTEEYVRLQRVGVILPEAVDRRELMGRVQLQGSQETTFDVATQPGLLGDDFFFPDGPASGKSNNAFYPDEKHLDTYRKFHRVSKATAQQIEFVMTIAQGQGTARMTELRRRIWCMPILSTSNRSVVELMATLNLEFESAYVDRLMDIPSPSETCFVENLHGFKDIASFAARACLLAEKNHGFAGRQLAAKFVHALRSDREELKRYVDVARTAYVAAAADITSSWRELVRVHGRFATIYASGLVAIRFGVLPFTPEELLAAILVCERDHVAFVDQEVKRLGVPVTQSPSAQEVSPKQTASVAVGAPASAPFARLTRYLKDNIPVGLVDLRDTAAELPDDHDHDNAPGYIGIHDKKTELWFSNDRFERIAGGKREGQALKK